MTPPEDTVPTSPLAGLDDQQLQALLGDVRERHTWTDHDVADTVSTIADLEIEIARRGLTLAAIIEPSPPALASRRCMDALASGAWLEAGRHIRWLGPAGTWLAFRHTCQVKEVGPRIHMLERLLFHLDCSVFDHDRAMLRVERLRACPWSDDDFAAYLEQCVMAHFDVLTLDYIPY
jgi:hypothetical protein